MDFGVFLVLVLVLLCLGYMCLVDVGWVDCEVVIEVEWGCLVGVLLELRFGVGGFVFE